MPEQLNFCPALILKYCADQTVFVPESVEKPLKYYENNTVKSRALIESAVNGGVRELP